MMRPIVKLSVCLTIVAACGTGFSNTTPDGGVDAQAVGRPDSGDEDGPFDAAADTGVDVTTIDAFVDATPDAPGCDTTGTPTTAPCTVDEKYGVFVSASLGSDSGDGSRSKPLKKIQAGIAAAAKAKKNVYVCAETYQEVITLSNGVSLYGYFACPSVASWTVGSARAAVTMPNDEGVLALDIASATRVENFSFKAPDATGPGSSSFGMRAIRAGGVSLINVKLTAGRGAAGAAGVNGVSPEQRGNIDGSAYSLGYVCASCNPAPELCATYTDCTSKRASKAGGVSACYAPGSSTLLTNLSGGPGGTGGAPAIFRTDCTGSCAVKPVLNADSGGGGNAQTSTGGTILGGVVVPAAEGAQGADGKDGANVGMFSESYAPSNGVNGTDGKPGQGGGGGAALNIASMAMSYVTSDTLLNSNSLWLGPTGSSGGAGGCAGGGATGAGGGGASVALLVIDGAIRVENCELNASAGGAGGEGKTGGQGTSGGQGANGWGLTGNSTSGGKGGAGGRSGHGGGGPSIGLVYRGAEPKVTTTTISVAAGGTSSGSAGLSAKTYQQK